MEVPVRQLMEERCVVVQARCAWAQSGVARCTRALCFRAHGCSHSGRASFPVIRNMCEVIQPVPQERISECMVEQIGDFPVPRFHQLNLEIAKVIPQERISECSVRQFVDAPVPRILEESVEAVVPEEEVHRLTVEHVVDVTFLHGRGR